MTLQRRFDVADFSLSRKEQKTQRIKNERERERVTLSIKRARILQIYDEIQLLTKTLAESDDCSVAEQLTESSTRASTIKVIIEIIYTYLKKI